jgi:hypothetical protein
LQVFCKIDTDAIQLYPKAFLAFGIALGLRTLGPGSGVRALAELAGLEQFLSLGLAFGGCLFLDHGSSFVIQSAKR